MTPGKERVQTPRRAEANVLARRVSRRAGLVGVAGMVAALIVACGGGEGGEDEEEDDD